MMDQQIFYSVETNNLDVTGAEDVSVTIRADGKAIWVNEGGRCLLRICQIAGRIIVNDDRRRRK